MKKNKVDKKTYRRIRYVETMKKFSLPYREEDSDLFHERYNNIVDQFSSPYEGLEDLLNFLAAHTSLKIGIITNGAAKIQKRKIKQLGLDKFIPAKHIFISDELGMSKPTKKIFDHAITEMDAKKSYLYVGDSWKHDIVGAIEAGWDAIFINTRNEKPSSSHTPIYSATTFSEVTEWMRENLSFAKG